MTSRTKENLFVVGSLGLFLVIKLSQMSFRFGDGNAYIYMASHLLEGFLPYRDFFLADPPLLVYLLAGFKLVFGQNLILFQALPIVFEAATGYFIYLLLKDKQVSLAWLGPIAYLFSFTVIATSDFLTGIQLTLFFLVLGSWLSQRQKDYWAGACFGLACLVKLYAIPMVLGFCLYFALRKDWPKLKKTLLGSFAAGLLVMLPSLLLSGRQLWDYMVVHQLNRPGGNSKLAVWQFLFRKEWLILALGMPGLLFKKSHMYLAALVLTAIFLLWFKDLYYMYFQPLILLSSLGFAVFIAWWWDNQDTRPLAVIGLIAVACFYIYRFTDYQAHNAPFGRFTNAYEIAGYAKSLDRPLYGSHEVAPLIALLADKKLFHNYIDTNTQAFASNGQNLKQASEEAVAEGVYLIARITDRPDLGIAPTGFEGYFDAEQFQHCKTEKEFASSSQELDNKIVIYFCQKN